MLNRTIGAVAAALMALGLPATSASADDSPPPPLPVIVRGEAGSANLEVIATDSNQSDGQTGGAAPGALAEVKSPSKRTCTYLDQEIECNATDGVWSQDKQCWVRRLSPQPPAEDPRWEEHTDGVVYSCRPPGAGETGTSGGDVGGGAYTFWAPDAGAADAPVLVDPVTLAEDAVERMRLVAPKIGMTPMAPGAPLLVGLDAWLWVDNDGPNAFGPITRTATAGSVSVRATAEVSKVVWDLGDGSRVTCQSAGTPWSPDQGTGPSPSCGHRYVTPSVNAPDGTFTVQATTYWQVDWSGAGQRGEITFTLANERQQEVTEVQVLQTS